MKIKQNYQLINNKVISIFSKPNNKKKLIQNIFFSQIAKQQQ